MFGHLGRPLRGHARTRASFLPHGIPVIAVGGQSEAELAKLREPGFEGATEPGVKG